MPWDAFLSGVEKLLHWFSPRFMCFVLILCGGLFFIPSGWASYLSVRDTVTAHRGWWGLGMLVSAAYLVPFGVSPYAERKLADRKATKKMVSIMSRLSQEEKRFLRRFFFPVHTGHVIVWKHEVGKLQADGVVFCPGESGLSNRQEVYSLTPAALRYIEKHKEFIVELEKTPHS